MSNDRIIEMIPGGGGGGGGGGGVGSSSRVETSESMNIAIKESGERSA